MSEYTKHNTTKQINQILRLIAKLSKYRARPFVMHLYEKGYSSREIAQIVGTSRQAVERDYPREAK
jgi:DNA-directed RNA polymerase specialized sigma24 family protein